MSDPVAILDLLAAVMVAVAVYCALRVVLVRRMHRTLHYDVNIAHVLMGLAMAGMLAPSLKVLPDAAWETVFSVLGAWFAWQSVTFVARNGLTGRSSDRVHGVSHYLTHLVMSCSMLYMFLAGVPASANRAVGMTMGPAAGTSDFVALPLFFIVVLCASAVWHVDALGRFTRAQVALASAGGAAPVVAADGDGAELGWLAPRLEMGCHIAMCTAMAFMLALLL